MKYLFHKILRMPLIAYGQSMYLLETLKLVLHILILDPFHATRK